MTQLRAQMPAAGYATVEAEEPALCGRWSGGTRDIAVRFDDGAGADGDIKTSFKNVTGMLGDVTVMVEMG
jgi:hypothetical protein